MKKQNLRILLLLTGSLILIACSYLPVEAQELRWMRVGQLQSFFMDYGAECELTAFNNNFFTWPSQYGDNQYTCRAKALWLGCKNFYDPVEKKVKSYKVVGAGPRFDAANQPTMVFLQKIKLIGRSNPPIVTVDNQVGTNNTLYDVLDEQQDNLPCDRMIVITFNTSMGVSVTKKIMAFTQQNHDSYFIHDYVFKNTGIINKNGDTYQQTLTDFWVYFNYRYAFSGVTTSGYNSTWGAFASEWGTSTEFSDFGPYRGGSTIRGFYGYYGPCKDRQTLGVSSYDQDWGCANQLGGDQAGLLGSAKYAGAVTLFASNAPNDWSNDNTNQPQTTTYIACDGNTIMDATVSQYDESFMRLRYNAMTALHPAQTHEENVGIGTYVADWRSSHPDLDGGGGTSQGQGYGPYTLASGDSIRIVFAEGVNGISWDKCRDVGTNWYAYFKGISKPTLVMPDGSTDTSYTAYTRTWVQTGKDSIMQMFRNAIANYNSKYAIPRAPDAPSQFTVESGGDRIRLSWADNARSSNPHFNGYVIYRSEGRVKDYRAVYTKIFECDKSYTANQYDDKSAARGFNYYYYIQSKDDGTQNDVKPGVPLYSSLFLTMTSVPATLQRPATDYLAELRVVPNPYNIKGRMLQFGTQSQYDRIAFFGLPPLCKLKIFTERGDLIWEKNHTNGTGDELWDSMTSSGQIVVSGVYILYVEVTDDTYATEDKVARHNVYDDDLKLMVREGTVMFHKGDLIFHKGDSKYRKFIIIR